MAQIESESQLFHPIQSASLRTGLSTHVIRAWERRYDAVRPQRTATSRRLYSDDDIERLILLRQATESGRRIGDIAGLESEALRQLISVDRASSATRAPQERSAYALSNSASSQHVEALLAAVIALDPEAFNTRLNQASLEFSVPRLIDEVLGALLVIIGERWRAGELRPSHEHFASSQLRTFLGSLFADNNRPGGPPVVVATPADQVHELGAIMAACTAASLGCEVIYLGSDLPSDEIAFVAHSRAALAVAISITSINGGTNVVRGVARLREQLPNITSLLIGGAAAQLIKADLEEVGATVLAGLPQFGEALDRLRHVDAAAR